MSFGKQACAPTVQAMQDILFVLSGLVVGTIIGLTGVGGGSLMTPLLIMGFGISPVAAVGTDLLFAAVTKFGGTLKLAQQRLVPWNKVALLSVGSIPAALATLVVLHTMGAATAQTDQLIRQGLGCALLLTAVATLIKVFVAHTPALGTTRTRAQAHWSWPVLLGAVIGSLVTLTSVGAGAIGVTALLLLFPSLALPRVVAADLAYAVPLTLVAGLGHASLGTVDWHLLALLLCGSLPGIWLGAHLLGKSNPRVIRSALSVLLAAAGFKLLAW